MTPDPAVATYVSWILPALWLLIVAASVDAGVRFFRPRRQLWLPLIGLFVVAFALRCWLPPGGWGDQRSTFDDAFYGWGNIADWGTHGRGFEALLAPLLSLIGTDARWIERLDLIAGALSVPLLVGVVRGLGLPTRTAWFAGALFAITPLHIRFSATMNRFIVLVALWLLAVALVLWRLRGDPVAGRRLRTLGAGAALVLAVQFRPESAWLVLAAVTVPWAASHQGRWPRQLSVTVVFAAALLLLPMFGLAHRMLDAPEWSSFVAPGGDVPILRGVLSPRHNLILCSVYTPLCWSILTVWGAAVGIRNRPWRRATCWLLGWALVSTAIVGTSDIDQDLLSARYHLLALPAWLALAAMGGMWVVSQLGKHPAKQTLAVVAVLGTALGPMGHVTRVTEQDDEVAFFRHALTEVPDGCALLTFDPVVQDLGVTTGPIMSFTAGRRHQWVRVSLETANGPRTQAQLARAGRALLDDALNNVRGNPCVLWVRSGHCFGVETSPGFEEARSTVCGVFDKVAPEVLSSRLIRHDTIGAHRFRPGPARVQLAWIRRP